jgi:hypothetical protein
MVERIHITSKTNLSLFNEIMMVEQCDFIGPPAVSILRSMITIICIWVMFIVGLRNSRDWRQQGSVSGCSLKTRATCFPFLIIVIGISGCGHCSRCKRSYINSMHGNPAIAIMMSSVRVCEGLFCMTTIQCRVDYAPSIRVRWSSSICRWLIVVRRPTSRWCRSGVVVFHLILVDFWRPPPDL